MNRLALSVTVGLLAAAVSGVGAERPYLADPLQHDIMSDEIFMDAAWHFEVEEVKTTSDQVTVTTTGATFTFSPSADRVLCEQRLAQPRRSLLLYFPDGALAGLEVTAQGTGAVILQSAAGVQFKVNCDSLLMIRSSDDIAVRCRLLFKPLQTYSHSLHHLFMDAFGAVGMFPLEGTRQVQKSPDAPDFTYLLGDERMLWCSIGPPREYPWEQSLRERLIWQGSWKSPELAVPSNELIDGWPEKGTILWLQSEHMLWTTWYHQDLVPRLPEEFQRVIDHSHEVGLRVIAYASPFYFHKGLGGHAYTGENMGLYLAAVADLLKRYPDLNGIYFDGVYPGSVKNTYIVCRATRELIGDDRILEIHCTGNAPGGLCYNPAADTWADFILRGEGQGFRSQNWLRFYVSCYNISNAIGVVCNNAGYWAPTYENVQETLRANARLAFMPWVREEFTTEEWEIRYARARGLPAKEVRDRHDYAMENWYWPRLHPGFPAWVERINREFFASGLTTKPRIAKPPHPFPELTKKHLETVQQAWLVMDSFGGDAPEYISPMTLNGVSIGDLPPSAGDQWTAGVKHALPQEALMKLQATNHLVIENPDRDCFKLRNIYIDMVLADGQQASSNLLKSVYCSVSGWPYTEGFAVPVGKALEIEIPIPLK